LRGKERPVRRSAKPGKANVEAKPRLARKSRKSEGFGVHDLEKRLAEARKRETEGLKREAEAQEQQAATAEILRVISSSPTDVQPVFDVIVRSAVRLCDGLFGCVFRFDGELMHLAAHHNYTQTAHHALLEMLPMQPRLDSPLTAARAILTRAVVQFEDLEDADTAREYAQHVARAAGFRSGLAVPMLHEGSAVGAIFVAREQPGLFSAARIELLKTFAAQAVIAIENVRLFKELEARNSDLHAALEQQTATSEILSVISSSLTDVQPVFDAIVTSAARLCDAPFSAAFRFDGELLQIAALNRVSLEETEAFHRVWLRLPQRNSVTGRAFLEGRAVHVKDVLAEADYSDQARELQRVVHYRTLLSIPMVRDGVPIGVITCGRREVKPFSEKQIALLQTFAAQAVIAIENVRLFNETKEALEQQTATGEILRVIASSPTDVQPVFDAVAESAARLCGVPNVTIFRRDGDSLRLVAHHGPIPIRCSLPVIRGTANGRAVLDARTVHIADMQIETEEFPVGSENARHMGHRTVLCVPLRREGVAIGTIQLRRMEVQLFSERQVALLQTFADQAVIAIENVRLFKELEAKNRDLTTALDQQTATSDILRVISRSQTDVQPVFDAILQSAVRLCGALNGAIWQVEHGLQRVVSFAGVTSPEWEAIVGGFQPGPLRPLSVLAWVVSNRVALHVPDIEREERFPRARELARTMGYRSLLGVPMLRVEGVVGAITLNKREPFTGVQIELLRTFADQAVIAIENVRLFTELQHKNEALTQAHAQVSESLEQQTATSEILRVISQSPTAVQPVFDAIVRSAVALCEGVFSTAFQFDGELIHLAAHHNTNAAALAEFHRIYPTRPSRGLLVGRAILEREVVHITDAELDFENQHPALHRLIGWRSALIAPMLREGAPIGVITVGRAQPGRFSESEIALLKTFADQAVIAIENVRLFTELKEKNRELTQAHAQVTESLDQQTATSEILRVIARSPTDVQPVFDTIAASASRLCGGVSAIVTRFDSEMIHLVAHHNPRPGIEPVTARLYPRRPGRESTAGRAILECSIVHIPDAAKDPDLAPNLARDVRAGSFLAVPMLRDGRPIGAISVSRVETGAFLAGQVELLKTFADQAVIAIENVRLFTELEARTQDLTRSVGELRALGEVGQAISSTLDLRTVLQTIVARATELAGADAGVIYEYDQQGEIFTPRATERLEAEIVETLIAVPVRKGEGVTGRLADAHEPIQLSDILEAPQESRVRDTLGRAGYRALLAVPLVRDDHLLGGLTVFRKTPGEFSLEVIELLRTFATQSALAIQNARLFQEIADKGRQLEAASQHKSEFLANMSHELRTPLNAVIGFSEVLSERMFGELNEKQEEYLKDIHASGQHLLSLINDILDLSKIEAGRMELELTDFDLPTAIDNALTLVRERAGRRGIAVHQAVAEGVGEIRGDERKVRQVALNLLSNAIKFTPEGGRIEVRVKQVNGSVEIAVSDTGVGIAPEDQEAIFEEFRQVGTADKKIEGTGLGLALSRKFIELHGGRIWVQSQVGMGSTFTFTIPMRIGT
jgi:GAF domain-containing protein